MRSAQPMSNCSVLDAKYILYLKFQISRKFIVARGSEPDPIVCFILFFFNFENSCIST